jgi:uncharacterized membrane protein YraQ (UPF0718 family)
MLAGPIINVVVISSTYAAFAKHDYGYWITGLRVGLGFLVAFGTALIVDWQYRIHGNRLLLPLALPGGRTGLPEEGVATAAEPAKPFWQRLSNITETALHDFTDITLFLILGALIAAFSSRILDKEQMQDLSYAYPVLAIVIMMALAILLCLCSEADAFVAASYTKLHAAAKLSFLVLGPMLDLKLFMMYTRVFRFRLIWTIIISVVVQVFLYSILCYYLWQWGVPDRIAATVHGWFSGLAPLGKP